MGKDHGRQQAEQQAREREVQAQAQITQANQPTPLQSQLEQSDLDFLSTIKSPTFDIRDPKLGLNPYLALYDSATASRNVERKGSGLLQLGTNSANPAIAANLNRLSDDRRRESAGGALENAFRQRTAEVTNSAMPLIQTDVNRNLNLAGLTSNRADSSWGNYFSIRKMPTAWESFRDNLARGAGQAAATAGTA
jgi:hypothetical protein